MDEIYFSISQQWIIIICFLALFLLVFIISKFYQLNKIIKERKEGESKIVEYNKIIQERDINLKKYQHLNESQKLQFQKNESDIKLKSQEWAMAEFEKFKSTELGVVRKAIEENAIAAAVNLLQKWKMENEAKIRQDATNRSYAVNLGKITEHLVPFHTKFPFNPKEARFMGSPIDLMVFDGMSEEDAEVNIYFVEIKTGKSRLSAKQSRIKSSVQNKRVIWHEINTDDLPE